jgi:hypothetical protein
MIGIVRVAAMAALVGSISTVTVRAEAPATPSPGAVGPSQQDLASQIAQLRQQLDALQAKADTDAKVATTTAATDAVLKDAEARSIPSLQATKATDFTAGVKNNKFIIQSADGSFSLSPYVQFQVRNVSNYRDNDDTVAPSGSTFENGFELRRLKVGAAGNLFSKKLSYDFLFDVPRNSGAPVAQFAWARYKFADDWSVRLGQFKNPLGKEQTTSGSRQIAAERSLLSDLLIGGDNPVQGIGLIFAPADSRFRFETAFTDGTNNNNTNFRDTTATFNAAGVPTAVDTRLDWGIAGRAELQLIGEKFSGYEDFTALTQKEQSLIVGAGADVSQNGNFTVLTYTADALYKTPTGLSLFGAVIGRSQENVDTDAAVATETLADFDDIGFVAHVAQVLPHKWAKAQWEVFGRYSLTALDDDSVAAAFENDVHEITAGVNAYFQGQNVKLTVDVTYLPNGSPVTSDGNGVIQSTDDQFVIRGQFQLLI